MGEQIPDSWVGRRVKVLAVRGGGYTSNYQPLPLRGAWSDGVLESVNDRGIVATLAFYEDEPPDPGVFYPWGAVLSIELAEGSG